VTTTPHANLWLNYSRRDTADRWTIRRRTTSGATFRLDGSGSSDPKGTR
jgi:hypothetical protein